MVSCACVSPGKLSSLPSSLCVVAHQVENGKPRDHRSLSPGKCSGGCKAQQLHLTKDNNSTRRLSVDGESIERG